jgi:hypothetical protein
VSLILPVRTLTAVSLCTACSASHPGPGAVHRGEPPRPAAGYVSGAGGVRLFYRVEGRGPDTIVVLHGGPGFNLEGLRPDLTPLADQHAALLRPARQRSVRDARHASPYGGLDGGGRGGYPAGLQPGADHPPRPLLGGRPRGALRGALPRPGPATDPHQPDRAAEASLLRSVRCEPGCAARQRREDAHGGSRQHVGSRSGPVLGLPRGDGSSCAGWRPRPKQRPGSKGISAPGHRQTSGW